jgi:hypothetical protein
VFSPLSNPASPAIVATVITAVNGTGSQATVTGYATPAGTQPQSTTGPANARVTSSAAIVTVGNTGQTVGTVATNYDLAFTGCKSSLSADLGVIYPNNVTLTTPTGTGTTGPSSAIALESGVSPINNASINFPSGLPAGYTWGGAGNPSTASVSFTSAKDTLNLTSDAETFVSGVVPTTDPYTTSKASMSFGVGSMVVCTDAEAQAIGTGSGGSGIDHSSIPAAANSAAVGPQSFKYCDGGSLSSVSATNAFGELALVEGAPNAGTAGSDGTGLAAIWQVGGGGSAIF